MTEDEALEQAAKLLSQEGTVESGRALEALEPYIDAEVFGDLWEAYIASTPMRVIIALDEQHPL